MNAADQIDRYAVAGNPINHTKSPEIHAEFARQTRQRMSYEALLVQKDSFAEALEEFQASGGKGLNVTLPFKHEAWELMDQCSDRANLAGAVNTIIFYEEGSSRYGDNTDGIGLVRDILANQAGQLEGKRILVLGAGGAVCGVVGPLLGQDPKQLVIANRTVDRAVALAERCSSLGNVEGCSLDELDGLQFDVIINGTAASVQGKVPRLPEMVLRPGGFCYDMFYSDAPTPFVAWGLEHGAAQSVDGLGMLVEQAAESFYLWRGVYPDTQRVIQRLRPPVSGRST
jgi:shikimate dehydrogenase